MTLWMSVDSMLSFGAIWDAPFTRLTFAVILLGRIYHTWLANQSGVYCFFHALDCAANITVSKMPDSHFDSPGSIFVNSFPSLTIHHPSPAWQVTVGPASSGCQLQTITRCTVDLRLADLGAQACGTYFGQTWPLPDLLPVYFATSHFSPTSSGYTTTIDLLDSSPCPYSLPKLTRLFSRGWSGCGCQTVL